MSKLQINIKPPVPETTTKKVPKTFKLCELEAGNVFEFIKSRGKQAVVGRNPNLSNCIVYTCKDTNYLSNSPECMEVHKLDSEGNVVTEEVSETGELETAAFVTLKVGDLFWYNNRLFKKVNWELGAYIDDGLRAFFYASDQVILEHRKLSDLEVSEVSVAEAIVEEYTNDTYGNGNLLLKCCHTPGDELEVETDHSYSDCGKYEECIWINPLIDESYGDPDRSGTLLNKESVDKLVKYLQHWLKNVES